MSAAPSPEPVERLTPLGVGTHLLSIYVLLILIVQAVFTLDPNTNAIIAGVDFFVCLIFLADFIVRLAQAPSKLAFMRWGWIDLLSSIPMLEAFRLGRLARLIRLVRLLRAFRSTRVLISHFLGNSRSTSFSAAFFIAFILVVFASLAMLEFETAADSNIKTTADAVWWSFTTITTVGYGDKFPVTTEGRIVACVLITAGVGLFGTFTGFIASLFIEPEMKEEHTEIHALIEEVKSLRVEVAALREVRGQPGAAPSLAAKIG